MQIALDYDDTYTRAPDMWQEFIALAQRHGHGVVCVTKRGVSNQGETVPDIGLEVIYTNRSAKLHYCAEQGRHFDIWIDDSPHNLYLAG